VPGAGQVRVAVLAAGVNPVDTGNRADGSWAGLSLPCILSYDIAGPRVQVAGSETSMRKVGFLRSACRERAIDTDGRMTLPASR
jgi:NADPH:quinone reductase-like Zn-dependent oxidoreductase